ncbi:hypothetical protein [Desulfobulbus elongatus]|uniref:hypothetical protein n=1 Tax=Desulfobulbus elongatus TaxID=53332 RepID=UPI0004888D8C|nr:hypothetical protein [Desulfobulbus elongatus]
MNRLTLICTKAPFLAVVALAVLLTALTPALAATNTPNPSPASPGYMVLPLPFSRTVSSASTVTMARIALPFPATVVSVTASAETIDLANEDETYTVDVKEETTSILDDPIGLAAADTVYQGVLVDTALADEAVLTVELTAAGTTPSITDVTVLLVLKRL